MKKYHILYKTTCLTTGKFYYGRHSTNNKNDKYLGSGKIILLSIKKYGSSNHAREILEECESLEELVKREEEFITPEMLADPNCMNLKPGGEGGKGLVWTEEAKTKLSNTVTGRKKTPEHAEKLRQSNIGKNLGKKPSAETLALYSSQRKGVPKSAEHNRKNSEALKAAWVRRKAKAALAQSDEAEEEQHTNTPVRVIS